MPTLQEIQDEAYATACSKGWHDRPLRDSVSGLVDHDRVLAKHALVHSELTEADICFYDDELALQIVDGKPEGFVVEVADAIIRIADVTKAIDVPLDIAPFTASTWQEHVRQMEALELLTSTYLTRRAYVSLYESCALRARRTLDCATEALRVNDWPVYAHALTHVVLQLASICAGLGLDLDNALVVKMAFNKTRPHRHGGKSA